MGKNKVLLLSIFCAGCLCGLTYSQTDPCDNPIDLSDARRSVSYGSDDGNYLCDNNKISEGNWYTFDSYTGGMMPETCPPFYSCGTQAPIWMNGSHPEDNNPTTVTACVNLDDCCSISYEISVKKCDTVKYVYQLANPEACDMAYCAGSGAPCEAGKVWVEENNKCEDGYPVMSGPPTLSEPIKPDDDYFGTFHFRCDLKYNGTSTAVRFEVKWYFDSQEDTNIESTHTTELSVQLDELKLRGHMGQTVSCSAKSYWVKQYDTASEEVNSENSYWVGIQGPALTVIPEDEEDDVEIVYTSTVPITCGCCLGDDVVGIPFKDKDSCKFQFRFNPHGTAVAIAANCYMIFEPGKQTASLFARAERMGNIRDQLSQVNFNTYNIIQNPIWDGFMIPASLVQVKNIIRTGHCMSVTDPHITTIDGKYYHLFEPGNFILVKSSSSRLFEIHSHLRLCRRNNRVSCNCGVAVREGNVIIGVDNCQGPFRTFKKILVATSQNHGTITTNAAGTQFTILMPSGAKVIATNDRNWHLNVDVYLPSEDYEKTEGLCGTWDGDSTNDFKKRDTNEYVSHGIRIPREFTNTYKLDPGKSFFDGNQECTVLLDQEKANHCKCDDATRIVCRPFNEDILDGFYDDSCNNDRKKKRETDDFESLFGDLAEEEEYTELGELTWPTASGITEDEATTRCREVLEDSPVNVLCESVTTVNKDELQAMCVVDIQVSDNLTVADSMLDVFEKECKEEAELNVVLNNDTDTGAQELAENIKNNVCVNHCSGKGSCVNSVCQCEQDYLGADCSVHRGTPPEITAIPNDGLCDTLQDSCRGIKVTASVIINGTVCRYREVEITSEGTNDLGNTILTDSTILSNRKTFCDLPENPGKVSAIYQLAISFDGENFSEEQFVYVYDSLCIECTVGGTCSLKPDTCGVAGQCYAGSTCTACEDAIDIGHPKRSSVYKLRAEDVYLCDTYRIVDRNWYRFDQYTGNQIPEQCVATWHCGTQIPIWFNGTHPTAEDPISSGQACANYYNSSCCDWSAPVTARYCTDSDNKPFYAYQLTPPPLCETAYCSGDKMPCEEGEGWDADTETCVDVDECLSNPCINGDCTNGANQFTCTCEEGYTGNTCDEEIDLCSVQQPCSYGLCTPGFNSYTCQCDPGYTGVNCEQDLNECESEPCGGNGECENMQNAYRCTCNHGYNGRQCNTGIWNSWRDWSTCSVTCGHGYQERMRTCMVEEALCEGDNHEYNTCFIQGCPTPDPDEEDGTEIKVSSDSLPQVVENENSFKEAIAESVNSYCTQYTEECCEALDLAFEQKRTNFLVTSNSVDILLQGNDDDMNIRLIITIDIDVERAKDFCGSESEGETLVLGDNIVAEAISSNREEIEQDTGVVITDVEKQKGDSGDEETTERESPEKGTNLGLIIGLAVVGTIALAAIFIAIVLCCKKGNKNNNPKRTASSLTVGSHRNMDGVGDMRATSPNMFLANQYMAANPLPPMYFNYDQMRPKTGVQKNTSLPPLGNEYQ